jgi:hypothetical protein
MVMTNYVIPQIGVPIRMHFINHELKTPTITDPTTRRPKQVNTLVFQVDELNGQSVVAYYSITSQKHAADFTPFLPVKYKDYDFVITVLGEGYLRDWQVQTIARVVR